MLRGLKHAIAGSRLFRRVTVYSRPGRFAYAHVGPFWRRWYRDVMASPDNQHIPRVPNAGKVIDGCQVMHNGLRIVRGSYYGYPLTRMLKLNRGVHEPQEEAHLPKSCGTSPRMR